MKVTVIATGFNRAGLPQIERGPIISESRMISGGPPIMMNDLDFPPRSERDVESELFVAAGPSGSDEGPVVDVHTEEPKNDLEMPAFLRRERRLFQ